MGTPKHLQQIGLVQNSVDDLSVDVNYLYSMALDKVAFLPFAYVLDKWRYDIFKGDNTKDQYNCEWWRLRYEDFVLDRNFLVGSVILFQYQLRKILSKEQKNQSIDLIFLLKRRNILLILNNSLISALYNIALKERYYTFLFKRSSVLPPSKVIFIYL